MLVTDQMRPDLIKACSSTRWLLVTRIGPFLLSLLFPPILVCFRDQQPPRELEASTQQLQKAACSVNPAISFGAGVSHVITCSVILEPVGLFNPSLHPSTDLANHQVLLPAFLPNQDVRD